MNNKMDLTLENREWKEFMLNDIFEIDKGVYLHSKNIIEGNNPFISAKSINNGVTSFIGNKTLFSGNSITVEKIKLSAFYQPTDFYCSHDVTVLKNDKLNKYNSKFICNAINRNGSKYSYGRQAQMNVVKKEKIFLPALNNEPDYEFMEQFIRNKEQEKHKEYEQFIQKRITQLKKTPKTVSLNQKKWDEFFLNEIFTQIQRGKRLKKADHIEGNQPYISSTGLNNGLDGYVGNNDNVRIFNNCITLANSGSVGSCFYQPFSFVASDHVTKLKNQDFSKGVYLFIASIVSRLGEKYSFNREMNDTRIKREKIMLPTNENNQPDYEFMENYMKNLELKKLTEYLNFKKS